MACLSNLSTNCTHLDNANGTTSDCETRGIWLYPKVGQLLFR